MTGHRGKGDNHCPGGGQTDRGSESAHLSVFDFYFFLYFIFFFKFLECTSLFFWSVFVPAEYLQLLGEMRNG